MSTKKSKRYPVSFAQGLMEFALKHCPQKQLFNIGSSLTVGNDIIELDLLEEALHTAIERNDAMRLRFGEKKDGSFYQYTVDTDNVSFERFDFTGWTQEDTDAQMRKWTEIPFGITDGERVFRIVLITMPDGYKGLYLNVCHLIMDSSGLIIFLRDVIELYCNKKYDFRYPAPLTSCIDALEKDLAYMDSERMKKDREFWENYMYQSEPIFTDIVGDGRLRAAREATGNPNYRAGPANARDMRAKHAEFHLEPDPTSRIVKFCLDTRYSMVCLLLVGIRTFLSKMNNGEQDVTMTTTVSRRGSVQLKKCGGTRIHSFPCRTIIPPEKTFLEALDIMKVAQFEIFRHSDFNPAEVLMMGPTHYKLRPGDGYDSLSVTYQPMTMTANTDEIKDVPYRAQWYPNGVAGRAVYLTVMHDTVDKGLNFYFEYQPDYAEFKDLEYMYYYLCKIIFKGVDNPNMTIGEIMESV